MHQVAAGKVAGLEAQIGAMSVYEGSLLREKNGIAVELGTVKEKLRRVENEKKGIREAQHKLFQARDKDRAGSRCAMSSPPSQLRLRARRVD